MSYYTLSFRLCKHPRALASATFAGLLSMHVQYLFVQMQYVLCIMLFIFLFSPLSEIEQSLLLLDKLFDMLAFMQGIAYFTSNHIHNTD